ncbi:MAG: hypothetical protein QNK30_04335 [Bacteroidales bacterium]|nr:hypothetical protein [Bacteroidales bacterium]
MLNKIYISKPIIALLFWLVFLLPSGVLNAQGLDDDKDLLLDTTSVVSIDSEVDWDLFGNQDLLRLSLSFDMKEYKKYATEPKYQEAVLTIHGMDGSIDKKVRIKPRGEFRRKYCSFPPLKVNVKKTDFDNDYLDKQTTFKFVTHCKNSSLFESYLLKEFLVYKLFNQLSDMSFKVRLIQMEYIDTGKKKKVYSKYGFIIEHVNSVASRNNAFVLKNEKLGQAIMDKDHMALVALFEYMVGNPDWSITGLHNMKVLKINDINLPNPLPVPYDFDYSGIINTEYAIPSEDLGIESITERLYRGICLPEEALRNGKEVLLKNKDELFRIIEEFSYLNKRERKELSSYLNTSFDIIESESSFNREIINNCID